MKGSVVRSLAALVAVVASSWAPSALAGDPQAHTAAMIQAAKKVALMPEFAKGVGAPDFKIPVPDGVPDEGYSDKNGGNDCFTCPIVDDACAKKCSLGAWVNEPDDWQCTREARQPEMLSVLNSQASPIQTWAAQALPAEAAMACNYTHFLYNEAPANLSAPDVQKLVWDWAQEIPTAIENQDLSEGYRCDEPTFRTYVARVAKSLHFTQDAESEHHAFGNGVCNPSDVMIPLVGPGALLDLVQLNFCRGWLVGQMARDLVCDAEVMNAEANTMSENAIKLRSMCLAGVPLACMGLERLMRHHCVLDDPKSIVCSGERDISRDRSSGREGYCEGERFSLGGEPYREKAAAASKPIFETAMKAWARACKKPDPCEPKECEKFCSRTAEGMSGFCLDSKPDPDCKPKTCVCDKVCGKAGQACCTWDPACESGNRCNRATGVCERDNGQPPMACPGDPDPGSSGGSGGTTGSTGNGGNGGDDGSDGGASNPGSAGNDGGPSGGTGGTTHGPPRRQYPGKKVKDPHLLTFDGLTYDLQAVGEFTLVRDASDGMEVQTRTKAYGFSTLISVVVGAAARVGSDRVAFYLDEPSTLNGVETEFSPDGTKLPDGGIVYRLSLEYVVVWPDGTQLSVGVAPACLNVELYLPATRRGNVVGLLGGFDGSLTDELLMRDGGALSSPADFETFYGVFAEGWRIAQQDSLLDYGPGENTETYTNRSFPYWLLRAQDLDAASADHAAQVCAAQGITDPFWLEACILDVGATGDDGFADQYAGFLPPQAALEILPPRIGGAHNGGGLGSAPVRSGTLGAGGEDFYSFAAKAGEGIQLRAVDVASGPFTPRLEVFDANGTLVSNNAGNEVAYASFNAGSSGTFTVVVSDASGRTDLTADYELYFFKGPGSNEGGVLMPGTFASDTIDKGDLDSYTFTATQGEGIQLRVVDLAGGAFVPALVIYGPTGSVVSTNYNKDVAYASFNAPATGTYTVLVHDWSAGAAATGDYELHYVKAPGAAEHGVLLPGTSVTETIDKGDLDSYAFTATQGEGVQLRVADLTGGTFVPSLVIYGPTGSVVSTNYNNDVAYASFNAPATGTYTVLVHDWSPGAAGSGDYELHYVKAPGAAEHGVLLPGTSVTETIDKGDLDSYTFTAAQGEGLQLRVADLMGGGFVPSLVIYGPTGSVVSTNYNNDVAYASFNAPATGTYTVLVHDWSPGAAGSGDYELHYVKAPGAAEHGALSAGGVTSGTIDKGDLDSYTFTASYGEGVQLRVVDLTHGSFVPALVVYGPTGSVVSTNYNNDVAYASFAAPAAGTYTVLVHDWSAGAAGAGDYDLHFAKAPGANEGGSLTPGSPVTATIDQGDLDSYTFTVTSGTVVDLSMTDLGATAFVPAFAVYNPAGGLVGSNSGSELAHVAFAAPVTGTYTVLAYDWSSGLVGAGSYSLALQ